MRTTVMEDTNVERLVDRFRELVEGAEFERLAGLYAPEALLDVTLPAWRFQLRGPDAIRSQFRAWYEVPARILRWDVRSADWGAVIEAEELHEDGIYFRYTYHLTIEDDRIARHLVFCPGAWTPEDVAHQRRHAPMVESIEGGRA